MTPPPEVEAWPDIDPSLYQSPFLPRPPRADEAPRDRGISQSPLTQEGEGLGVGASLVPYISITPKIRDPSDIAFDALSQLDRSDSEYKLCSDYVHYLDQCEQKKFLIKGYDTVKGKIINLPMEYTNRWCPIRRSELSEKLKRLEYWFELQEDRPVTMITLTSGRRDLSIAGAWQDLNKSKKKLQDLLRFYFGDVDYFWVSEPHKDGYVHYHMAVFADVDNSTKDKRGEGIEDKLRNLWSKKYGTGSHTYGLDFSQKQGDGKIQHLKNYLSKYLEKGFLLDKWTRGMLIFNANLWETGFRMYGASKRIREMMNIEPDKPSQIVWLETKMQSPEITPEGEDIEIEKIIWYRQYIPDWIDSDFWLTPKGDIVPEDPPPKYIYDWGRPCSHHAQEYKVTSYQDMNIPKRKQDINPYDTWRPAHTNTHK